MCVYVHMCAVYGLNRIIQICLECVINYVNPLRLSGYFMYPQV